jgi:hypothetical protein
MRALQAVIELNEQVREELVRWSSSRQLSAGDVFKAKLILALADGVSYSRCRFSFTCRKRASMGGFIPLPVENSFTCCHAALKCRKMRSESKYCTQFPEYAEFFVLKSRIESDACKKDRVIFVLISRTNFSRNFVRVLCATVRDFSAVKMQSNPGKGLKTNKRDSGN